MRQEKAIGVIMVLLSVSEKGGEDGFSGAAANAGPGHRPRLYHSGTRRLAFRHGDDGRRTDRATLRTACRRGDGGRRIDGPIHGAASRALCYRNIFLDSSF